MSLRKLFDYGLMASIGFTLRNVSKGSADTNREGIENVSSNKKYTWSVLDG